MSVQQNEVGLTSFFGEWVSDFLGKLSQETFKVQSVASVGFIDFLNGSEYKLVLALEAKGLSGHQDISHLGSSLSGVGVQGEHGVEVCDEVFFEDGVFGSDGFCHDGFEVFFGQLSFGHFKSFYLINYFL